MSEPEATGTRTDSGSGIYHGIWQILAEWFMVPRQAPELPAAETDGLEAFRPARTFLSYMRCVFWMIVALVDLPLLGAGIAALADNEPVAALLVLGLLAIAVVIEIVVYLALQFRYDTTWYAMTDHSLRIRRGVWVIREMTFTFDNVQNVKIERGPLERIFGIARVMIETAGSSGKPGKSGQVSNQGVIEGVADATRIRDKILDRLKRTQSAGLGDEAPSPGGGGGHGANGTWTTEHVTVLRDILTALRAGEASR